MLLLYIIWMSIWEIYFWSLNRIEINFRTKLVYYVSNKYKSSTWFINPRVIDNRYISTIGKYYNEDFKRTNKTIKLHHSNNINDLYAPMENIKFFTFGAVLKLSNHDTELKIKLLICMVFWICQNYKFVWHYSLCEIHVHTVEYYLILWHQKGLHYYQVSPSMVIIDIHWIPPLK
jgi:hypothetical protein